MKKLSIIIPCYNEAGNLKQFHSEVVRHCNDIDFEIIFVNDGSTDESVSIIRNIGDADPRVQYISFLVNSGHQAALRAGLRHAHAEYIVMLDADLQHPPRSIPAMLAKAQEGFDIITMVHSAPQKGILKKICSQLFYGFFSVLSGVKLDSRASDFRLISRRVQSVINLLPERNLFIRAFVKELGFGNYYMEYDLAARFAGKPAYTFRKSFTMAKDAIFNFSTFPIRFFFNLGLCVAFCAFCYAIFHVLTKFLTDWNVPGFTDIIASVLFLGGLNLIMLSIIGKYVQIVLEQVKQRPEYIIDMGKSDIADRDNSE